MILKYTEPYFKITVNNKQYYSFSWELIEPSNVSSLRVQEVDFEKKQISLRKLFPGKTDFDLQNEEDLINNLHKYVEDYKYEKISCSFIKIKMYGKNKQDFIYLETQ